MKRTNDQNKNIDIIHHILPIGIENKIYGLVDIKPTMNKNDN